MCNCVFYGYTVMPQSNLVQYILPKQYLRYFIILNLAKIDSLLNKTVPGNVKLASNVSQCQTGRYELICDRFSRVNTQAQTYL